MQDKSRTLGDLEGAEPIALMQQWLDEAAAAVELNPNAASLATASADGVPDVRYVLVKGIKPGGICFYTNRGSAKGQQLQANPHAALALYWRELGRQLRCRGYVRELVSAEVASYFATRTRESQLGAWASRQSRPLSDPAELHAHLRLAEGRYSGREVPLPSEWTGYCLEPASIVYWQEGPNRLHERIRFMRSSAGLWQAQLVYP